MVLLKLCLEIKLLQVRETADEIKSQPMHIHQVLETTSEIYLRSSGSRSLAVKTASPIPTNILQRLTPKRIAMGMRSSSC